MATAKNKDWRYWALITLGIVWIAFQLYIALVTPLDKWIQVPLHLCLGLWVCFLNKPMAYTFKSENKTLKGLAWIYDAALIAMIAYVLYYFLTNVSFLQTRIYYITQMRTNDLIAAYFLVFLLLEAVRRTMGLSLFVFIILFILYAFFGQYIKGVFKYNGMTWKQFGEVMTMDPNGITGTPLTTSVTTLYYFLIFGAFFSVCGGGQVLIDLGMKLSDKTVGGPAKASVISSGLMGMISGSAVANVTTTGVLTIPLMKKSGYEPHQAGAVEAVASTGGQIMPPIMGVGAFIMAEMIGISYFSIAAAALIPALCYYGSVFLLVHFIAKKKDMTQENSTIKYECEPILPRLYQLLPMIILVIMIVMGRSLKQGALVATGLAIVVSFFKKETRFTFSSFLDTLLDGTKQAAGIAIPTGACGIMIGIVVRSGVAQKLTKIIAVVGSQNLAIALVIAMLGCMLLGMALPTVAAYLIANVLFCSTLISLGIDPLPANMFIFYFGVIAQITPPVCLASFTAAGIAGASSWKTGWTAFAYAFVSFLVPYVFVFEPSVILQGTFMETVLNTAILAYGIVFLCGGVAGYLFVPIENKVIRAALFIIAIMIITPDVIFTVVGAALGVAVLGYYFLQSKKYKKLSPSAVA